MYIYNLNCQNTIVPKPLFDGIGAVELYNIVNNIVLPELSFMVWYGNILFDIVHNIIENILTKHRNI